jgi:hypothetical protein
VRRGPPRHLQGTPDHPGLRDAIEDLEDDEWQEAIEGAGEMRDGTWVAEVTEMLDLEAWPKGSGSSCEESAPTHVPS